MARRRPRESYPPPLFVAELDTTPVHGSVTSPEGRLAFEMQGESVPVRVVSDEPERRPARTSEVDENVQANPWPFYLDQELKTAGGGASKEDMEHKEGEVDQANPWPYHGPASGDDAPSATIYPQPQVQQQGPQRKSNSLGGCSDGPAVVQESLKHPEQTASPSPYPAPLRVSRPNSMSAASPPHGIKPYSPPPDRDDIPAVGVGSPSFGTRPKSPIQGRQSPGLRYRPYRPPNTSSASGATTAQSPSVMGTAPHHFYTPFSSDFQPTTPQKQVTAAMPDTEDKPAGQSPSIKPYSPPQPPPSPPPKDSSPTASTQSPAQEAAPTPATTASRPQSPPPVTMAHAQAPLAQSSPSVPAMTPVSPLHTPSSGIPPSIPPSPASVYNIPHATYATSPSLSLPQAHQPRPQVTHASTGSSSSHTGYTPASPPPAYQYPGPEGRPDSQPAAQGQQHHPPYSPPPPSPYPSQPMYAANTGQQNPPLPRGKPPPPLPPRRPNVSYGGFGGAPSNAANFPPPPKTYYNPMPPPYPPRPSCGGGGGGCGGMSSTSLFSASSARKWLDKTSQVLESKLESVLQGPQGPAYRPAYTTGPPPQAYSSGTQTRGMPPAGYGYGPGPWGPGPGPGHGPAPPPPPAPPGWRGPP